MTRAQAGELRARDLVVRYPGTAAEAPPALALPDLTVAPGRSIALVGESGSGKSTALAALLGLVPATAGSVTWDGVPVGSLRGPALRTFRRAVQPIPQDVDGALDPRQTVGAAIAEGVRARADAPAAAAVGAEVGRLLDEVGLPADVAGRHPHALSGGQRQRAVIARALAVRPRILLLDEPTSGLDATVQARILDLLERVRAEHGLGILLVSHNLAVVGRLCPDTVVLYRGEVVEHGPTALLLAAPRHPYTAALRRSVPEIGSPFRDPRPAAGGARAIASREACRFAVRCPWAEPGPCGRPQALVPLGPGHAARCARVTDLGPLDPLG